MMMMMMMMMMKVLIFALPKFPCPVASYVPANNPGNSCGRAV